MVVVDGVACDRGDRRRGVRGNDLSSESSLMMAGVYPRSSALETGVYTLTGPVHSLVSWHRRCVRAVGLRPGSIFRFLVDDGAQCMDLWRGRCSRGHFAKKKRSQCLDRGELIGWGFLDSLNSSGKTCRCVKDPIHDRDAWDRDGMVAETECVGDALATSVGH